jgi:surface protein
MATMMAIIATATGWAQTSYGIKIDGVEITSANYQNITSANGFSAVTSEQGSVTYDPATNTLTLDGAQIDGTLTTTGPKNIVLIGSNMLEATMLSAYDNAISLGGDCTISGFGSLNCSASNGEGIYIAANCTLTIKDCSVTVNATGSDTGYGGDGYDNGEGHGIRSAEGATAALVVDHAYVSASGTNGSIRYISSLTLNGCEITSPQGASFESGWQGVGNSGGIIKDNTVIIDIIPVPYAVYDGQGTMTIFYDKMKNRRTGTIWDVIPNAMWQSWYSNKDITTIDFDESFSNYKEMTSLSNFFANMTNLVEIKHLNRLKTNNVTDMHAAFNSCPSLTELDLSGFNTANVTTMSAMFAGDTNLKTIIVGNEWSTESCVCDNMFYGCTSLVGSQGTTYKNSHFGATYAHIDHGESNPGYLTGVKEAYAVRNYVSYNSNPAVIWDINWQTLTFYYDDQKSEWGQKVLIHEMDNGYIKYSYVVYDIEGRDWRQDNGANIVSVVFNDSFANYHGLTDLSNFFDNLKKLTWVSSFENLNTENVTTMNAMFYQCEDMGQIDLRFLNTENVTDMTDMFNGCTNLSTIRCNSNWQRDGLVSTDMFLECTKLKSYDPSKTDATMANPEGYFTADEAYAVLDAEGTLTFYYDNGKEFMQALQPNYSYFSFTGTEWVGPNGSKWNDGSNPVRQYIKKVAFDESFALYHGLVTTEKMFYDLYNLESIEGMENLDTENVTCMDQMFANCIDLKHIDLSHFDTSKVTSMMGMFGGCSGLTTIYCKSDWKQIAENNGITLQSAGMFEGCYQLKGGMGTAYSNQCIDANYAHLDSGEDNPGYFSRATAYAVREYLYAKPDGSFVIEGETLTFYYDDQMASWGQKKRIDQNSEYRYKVYPIEGKGWTQGDEGSKIAFVVFDESFADYQGLTDLSNFFSNLPILSTVDIAHCNTTKVTSTANMFANCSRLVTINCNTDWKLIAENNGITLDSENMFQGCERLNGGMGTVYSANNPECQDANYAHPDNVSSPGFFTCTVEKGNMNDDNNIDEVDIQILTDAILGKIAITADLIAKGDMNYDGALTIADVTLLVDAILKQE